MNLRFAVLVAAAALLSACATAPKPLQMANLAPVKEEM